MGCEEGVLQTELTKLGFSEFSRISGKTRDRCVWRAIQFFPKIIIAHC